MVSAWLEERWNTMRRADRLFEIIQVLRRARRPVAAELIARELEVSKRTIYRDVAALVAQRVPIIGEAGVGYVLEEGFDMPPLMLTDEEVDAAVLGAQWVANRGEPELAQAALSLLAKIEVVVPERLRAFVLHPATSIAPGAPAAEVVSSKELRAAIHAHRKLRITYKDGQGRTTDRVVWPVLIGYRETSRILAAWCELRQDFRYFRTDRMAAAEPLAEAIPERPAKLHARWRAAMDAERIRYASEVGSCPLAYEQLAALTQPEAI